ncbi:MAG TPA: DMT family transporter [Clostridia bacterium]|nr:DMT family transporter [Clostridia bacterium]
MTKKTKSVAAGFGLLLTAMIWGFAFVVVKNSLNTMPPIYMLAIRFSIAVLGLCLVFHKKLKQINLELIKMGAIPGAILFLGFMTQTIGCQYTTAGKNAFLTAVYVVMVPFFNFMINRQKPDKFSVAAGFVAIVGIGLISLNGNLSINVGDVLTLICGVFFAIHIVFIERYITDNDPIVLVIIQMATAGLLSWLTAPVFEGSFPVEVFDLKMVASMLYLSIFSTMVAYLLQTIGQKYTPAPITALLLSMEAVFGVVFSAIFLKEIITIKMFFGCAILLFAIVMAETKFDFIRRVVGSCGKKHALSSEQGTSQKKRSK